MRIRKTNAIIGVSLAVGALFMIYLVVDTLSTGYEDPDVLQVNFERQICRNKSISSIDSLYLYSKV
jgi:hypothetical protein